MTAGLVLVLLDLSKDLGQGLAPAHQLDNLVKTEIDQGQVISIVKDTETQDLVQEKGDRGLDLETENRSDLDQDHKKESIGHVQEKDIEDQDQGHVLEKGIGTGKQTGLDHLLAVGLDLVKVH